MNILLINLSQISKPVLDVALRRNWETSAPTRIEDGVEFARQLSFQAIFVEVKGRGKDRFDPLKALTALRTKAPVIAVLSTNCSSERARAWELGAAICLTEPLNSHEIEMATRVAVRLFAKTEDNIIRLGGIEMDLAFERISASGENLKLTRKEFLLLEMLMLANGRTVTRDQILNQLYCDKECPDAKIIDVFVCKLRAKLQKAASLGDAIVTSWGVGYRMAMS
ncbi:winged helix-turn-helix domain-containing protein [Tateyamaria sp.]|uniref:winged helix-turn-helix domain-containing protein n=1 Tax=Tateyamaria sp. TaxID=1929288 RepID=UPI00329B277B